MRVEEKEENSAGIFFHVDIIFIWIIMLLSATGVPVCFFLSQICSVIYSRPGCGLSPRM